MPERFRLGRIGLALLETGISRPRFVIRAVLLVTLVLGLLILRVQTDTDPENMLSASDPVRLRNAELSEQFGSTNSILVGLSRDTGVATVEFLAATDRLIDEVLVTDGVIAAAVVSYRLAASSRRAPPPWPNSSKSPPAPSPATPSSSRWALFPCSSPRSCPTSSSARCCSR